MNITMDVLRKEMDDYTRRFSLEGEESDGTPVFVSTMNRIASEMKIAQQLPLLDQMRFLGFKSVEETQFIHLVDMHMTGLGFTQVSFAHPDIPNGHHYLQIKWTPADDISYTVIYRHLIGSGNQGDWYIMYGSEPIRHVDCGNLWKNMEVIYTTFPPTSESDKE